MKRATCSCRSYALLAPLVVALSLIAAGCIPPDPDPNAVSVAGDGELTLLMNEFSFSPSHIALDAGSTVTIDLVNEGVVEHELMIGRDVRAAGGYDHDLLAAMLDGGGAGASVESASAAPADGHGDEMPTDGHGDEMPTDGHGDEMPTDSHGDEMPTDSHGDEMPTDGHGDGMGHSGTHITVQPGQSVRIVLDVPTEAAGEWQIGCFVEGHFEAGMVGEMTVRQPTR